MSATACTSGGVSLSIADCVRVVATPVVPDPEVGALSMTSLGLKDCAGTQKASNFSRCWP